MKRTFRILEIKNKDGELYYIVQQKYFGFIWYKADYDDLIRSRSCFGDTTYSYVHFKTIEDVKKALEKVKEAMLKNKTSYKKVVEKITIEV